MLSESYGMDPKVLETFFVRTVDIQTSYIHAIAKLAYSVQQLFVIQLYVYEGISCHGGAHTNHTAWYRMVMPS